MNLADTTVHTDKETGQTLSFTLTITGASGTPEWTVGILNPEIATISGAASGTGTSVAFTGLGVFPGTGQFVVQAYDPPTGQYTTAVVDMVVVPKAYTVLTAAGDLFDTDIYRMVLADAGSGGFTRVLPSASGRGGLWWLLKNSGSVNNVTVGVQSGEYMNGTLDGTLVLTPGQSAYFHPNNSNRYDSVRGA